MAPMVSLLYLLLPAWAEESPRCGMLRLWHDLGKAGKADSSPDRRAPPVLDVVAAWRVAHGGRDIPGRSISVDARCGDVREADSVRQNFITRLVGEYVRNRLSPVAPRQRIAIGEIGPCGQPVRLFSTPALRDVDVEYVTIDFTDDVGVLNKTCFMPPSRVDVVADAQSLANVQNGTFDAIIALHVLEHMPDAIGAVKSWLRVLKPHGLAIFAVPNGCGKEQNADVLRATAGPLHYLSDHDRALAIERRFELTPSARRKPAADAAADAAARAAALSTLIDELSVEHEVEQALSWASFVLNVAPAYIREVGHFPNFMALVPATAASAPCPNAPAELQPLPELLRWATKGHRKFHSKGGHLHVWSPRTMRGMLVAAKRRKYADFRVAYFEAAQRTRFQMPELHVALEAAGPVHGPPARPGRGAAYGRAENDSPKARHGERSVFGAFAAPARPTMARL
ncbi:hypothetical protein M885DRAFT_511988 [Pelagophyceae sp. CCMP2097]|nr:hypothetical protein M885DRAFT_511988 [Pelagophyceae sp. CCMP2097]